jgi:hypothetical protein
MVQGSVLDEINEYRKLMSEGIITKKEFTIKEYELIKSNKISIE